MRVLIDENGNIIASSYGSLSPILVSWETNKHALWWYFYRTAGFGVNECLLFFLSHVKRSCNEVAD